MSNHSVKVIGLLVSSKTCRRIEPGLCSSIKLITSEAYASLNIETKD